MNAWPAKDIVYLGLIVFNMGVVVGTLLYVIKRLERDLRNIFSRLIDNEKEISEIRGELKSKKDK